jgi:hypothetical protein
VWATATKTTRCWRRGGLGARCIAVQCLRRVTLDVCSRSAVNMARKRADRVLPSASVSSTPKAASTPASEPLSAAAAAAVLQDAGSSTPRMLELHDHDVNVEVSAIGVASSPSSSSVTAVAAAPALAAASSSSATGQSEVSASRALSILQAKVADALQGKKEVNQHNITPRITLPISETNKFDVYFCFFVQTTSRRRLASWNRARVSMIYSR